MKRILSLFLTLMLLVTCLTAAFAFTSVGSIEASAASNDPKRVIAIVFDNSGSMYLDGRTRWCHATYAMEVFATMMNDSDEMYIYPMHKMMVLNDAEYKEVKSMDQRGKEEFAKKISGDSYSSRIIDPDSEQQKYLKVTKSNASQIRKIFTLDAADTPYEQAYNAKEFLVNESSATADNKWLIILTDGAFKKQMPSATVVSDCANYVNTMYLGMETPHPTKEAVGTVAFTYDGQTASEGKMLSTLSSMCNTIFGRDDLSGMVDSNGEKYLADNNAVKVEIPMKKLIVFVQGDSIQNVKLGSLSPTSTSEMKYSEAGAGTWDGSRGDQLICDTALQGQLLTFENVPADTYNLSFDGTKSSVAIYYEPNVKLEIAFADATGNPIDPNKELYPGDYEFSYRIVDADGNAIPESSTLLGEIKYDITYKHNETEQKLVDNPTKITLGANDTLDAYGTVKYLITDSRPEGYEVSFDRADLGWPAGGLVVAPPPAGQLKVKISGGESSYNLTSFEANAPVYRVEFIYEGNTLSGSELDRVDANASISGGSINCKLERDSNGYYITTSLATSLLDAQVGYYEVVISGTYTNEDGLNTDKPSASTGFELIDNSGQITMELDVQQDYFLIKDLADGKPIKVKLMLNGVPLTDEQLANTKLTTSVEGLALKYEAVNGESAFKVWIDPDQSPEPDKYEITIGATTKNEIGREVYAEQKTSVQVRSMPQWLRVLLPIVGMLFVLFLVWVFMNMKVLPKGIVLANCTFNVDGERVPGTPQVSYSGGGKNEGSLAISSPRVVSNPLAKAGLSLELVAVSPRYTRSKQRKMCISAKPSPVPRGSVSIFSIGTGNYTRDMLATNVDFVKVGTPSGSPHRPFNIGNNARFSISAELPDGTSVSFSGTIKTQ